MALSRSPGGSVYPYFYKGGELYCVHLGSFFDDEDGLILRLAAEQGFILSHIRSAPMWIDFYETELSDRFLEELKLWIDAIRSRITKLAVVGCSHRDRRRVERSIAPPAKTDAPIDTPVRFFRDPEEAKSWLVGRPF